jgi:hypothetical protein
MVKLRWTEVNGHLAALSLDLPELDAEAALQFFVRTDIKENLHG